MKIILTSDQYDALFDLINNDQEYQPFLTAYWGQSWSWSKDIQDPAFWSPYIKHKYKLRYRVSDDEDSEIYYGSLYGTKSRINMMLLRL